jgi:hypothetical protein
MAIVPMKTINDIVKLAKKSLIKDGYLDPYLLIEVTKNGVARPYLDLPAQELIKLFEAVGYTLAVEDQIGELMQVFMVNEGWSNTKPGIKPTHDPSRVEVVSITHCDVTRDTTAVALFEMVRDKGGRLRS